MKKYRVQKGDTLNSLAEKFAIKDGASLRAFHNIYCPLEDLLDSEVVVGKELLIAEEAPYIKEKQENNAPQNNDTKTEVAVSQSSKEAAKKKQVQVLTPPAPLHTKASTLSYKRTMSVQPRVSISIL
ncbi:hypothetical protein [Flavobacterium davisii]|uniref:hypothetical protein n=1 Tax=Flavobacterium davisii TaxID=2906077 RepID=UPI002164D56C|nr:hypothetical protein [Flavobacterium davisii]